MSDRALNTKEESSEEEEEKPPAKPKLPPAPPKVVVESAPSQQSMSETNTPFTDDEASRLSAPGQFDEESSSQPGFGPPVKEEAMKIGFGSLKLGGYMCSAVRPVFLMGILMFVFVSLSVCLLLAHSPGRKFINDAMWLQPPVITELGP